jgi:multiple sugar transport system permease protein
MTNKKATRRDAYMAKKKAFGFVSSVFLFLLVLGLCFVILNPILKLVPSVFSRIEDLGNPNIVWLPMNFSVVSFKAAARMIMPEGMLTMVKSVLYAAIVMFLQIFFSAMAGYSLARVDFKGRKIVFFMVILAFLVPRQSLLLAQYIYFNHFDAFGLLKLFVPSGEINLIDKPAALYILAIFGFGVKQSLFVLIFSQFFKNIPKELEEAALLDGCGFYKTYFKIMVPNAVPAISTVAVLSFVWNFGDTYYTRYFNPNGAYIGSIMAQKFIGANKNAIINAIQNWYSIPTASDLAFDAVKQAGALIYLIPLLIVYMFAQKWLVENLENSGLVG